MKIDIYNQKGEKTESAELSKEVFDLPWNGDLVHQVAESIRANQRINIAYAKDRSAVRGGGAKPWRQKGTGRARHGSSRSPIWIGGGVTHGPTKEKDYSKKINKKMKRKAFLVTLSQKLRDKEIIILDELKFDNIKTKQAAELFKNLSAIKGFENINDKKTLVALSEKDDKAILSLRNLPKVATDEARNLNTLDLLSFKYLLLPKSSLKVIERQE